VNDDKFTSVDTVQMAAELARRAGAGPVDPVTGPRIQGGPIDLEQLELLTEGVVLQYRLRELYVDQDLQWVLPHEFLPQLTHLHGLPVLHADVPYPLLAHKVQRWEPPDEDRTGDWDDVVMG
jgi:hypothetical protein